MEESPEYTKNRVYYTRNDEGEFVVANTDGDDADAVVPEAAVELEGWLRNAFEAELPGTIDKAILYGSVDLEIMADAMGKMMPHLKTDALRLQAAISFYLLGKVARAMGALRDGREPTADTWYDAHIYSMMGLKIQETGFWLRTE